MRFSLSPHGVDHFFDTLPDMINALHLANEFKPFENDVQFKATAFDGDCSVDLVITGIKFEDYISFGLNDETRQAYDLFEERMSFGLGDKPVEEQVASV